MLEPAALRKGHRPGLQAALLLLLDARLPQLGEEFSGRRPPRSTDWEDAVDQEEDRDHLRDLPEEGGALLRLRRRCCLLLHRGEERLRKRREC